MFEVRNTDSWEDEIRDVYRRAQGEELVVEGLREGQDITAEQ